MVEEICIKNFCVILFRNTINHTHFKYVTYLLVFFVSESEGFILVVPYFFVDLQSIN